MTDTSKLEEGKTMNKLPVRRDRKAKHTLLSHLLNDYSRSSTLHGLRYITEREISVYEKTFWLITFVVSVSICFTVIINLYMKWKSNPIIVTVNENIISASQIPFPSITICPQSKCRVSVYDYSHERKTTGKRYIRIPVIGSLIGRRRKRSINEKRSESEAKENTYRKFSNIATVCEGNDVINNKLKYYDEKPSDASLVRDLEEVAEPIENIFFRCIWRSKKIDCGALFKKVLTREGVCFNMNSIAASKILNSYSLQSNYSYMNQHVTDMNEKPEYGRINGAGPDMDIVLKMNISDRDMSCNTLNNGYKIYMQHPNDMPTTSLYFYSALKSEATSLALKCDIMNTSLDLKDNTPEERQCYFEGERNLTYFSTYTANNCWLECLSNYTYKKCGCVGFYMPHNSSNEICNFVDYRCIIDTENQLAEMEASGDILKGCNCWPACDTVAYSAEATVSDFNFKTLWEIENDEKFDNSFQYSRIVVFFQQPGFVAMRRSKLFGWLDFIASCGGLLGLFLGFSVLSIVEILYYVTLRFWCTSKRALRQEDKKSMEIYTTKA